MHRAFRFGEWSFDADSHVLSRAGEGERLEPRVARLLEYFLERRDELLSHDELVDNVWDGRVVSDEAIRRAVSTLRRALRADDPQDIIQTVHGCGYIGRFPPPLPDLQSEALPDAAVRGEEGAGDRVGNGYFSALLDGIRRLHNRIPLKAWLAVAAGALTVEIVASLIVDYVKAPEGGPPLPLENSLAVLPFDTCQDNPVDRVLAGGLTGAVHNRLAQHETLKIVGRNSTDTVYKAASGPAAVAALLGVRYLLNGVLCREGGDLSLHAELTDQQGFTVWEQDFTERVNAYNQVQHQLAVLVENGIAAEFGQTTRAAAVQAVDRRALEQFLIGREFARRGEDDKAREAMERAIEIGPDYVLAKLELGWMQAGADFDLANVVDGYERVYATLEELVPVAEAQVSANPRSLEANRVAGRILYGLAVLDQQFAWREYGQVGEQVAQARHARSLRRYAESEQYFRVALSLNPTDSDVRARLADAMSVLGPERRKDAFEVLQGGLEWDPFNERLAIQTAQRQIEFGAFRQAMELIDRFDELPQGKSGRLWFWQLELLFNYRNHDEQLARMIDLLDYDPEAFTSPGIVLHFWRLVGQIAGLGLVDEAEKLYELAAAIPRPEGVDEDNWKGNRQGFLVQNYLYATNQYEEIAAMRLAALNAMSDEDILSEWEPKIFMDVLALWHGGERDRAIRLLEGARLIRSARPDWAERQAETSARLARMLMTEGRDAEARPVLEEVVEVLQRNVDAGVRHHEVLGRLAEAYGWLGMRDEALSTLELAVDYGLKGGRASDVDTSFTCDEPRETDPPFGGERRWWETLCDAPQLKLIAARLKSVREQQAANTRALLQMHDMSALLGRLSDPAYASRR